MRPFKIGDSIYTRRQLTIQAPAPNESRHGWGGKDGIPPNKDLHSTPSFDALRRLQDLDPTCSERDMPYLLHSGCGSYLEDSLDSFFIEVAPISSEAYRLALHLVSQRVEQRLDPGIPHRQLSCFLSVRAIASRPQDQLRARTSWLGSSRP